jgi:hypothetical protein
MHLAQFRLSAFFHFAMLLTTSHILHQLISFDIYFKTQYPAACCAWVRRRRFT